MNECEESKSPNGLSDDGQSIDECTACGGTNIETPSEIPCSICIDCGVAIGTSASPEIPSNISRDKEETEPESWDDYYSVTNSTEKQIATAFAAVEEIGEQLSLSADTRSQIADVYASAAVENITDGRRTRLTIAAATCIGCREVERPRPAERVAQTADLEPETVKRTIRIFQEKLDRGFSEVSPASYVPFFCSDAGLSSSVETESIELIQDFPDAEIRGVHPAGVAGAAIYLVADGAVTQRGIAEVVGVTKETIRVRVAEFRSEGVE